MFYRKLGTSNVDIPAIGQGTWKFGEEKEQTVHEIEALRYGMELGMTLIDTAEGYANGGAERIVAEAIADCRKDVFLVTKVLARNCSYDGVLRAAEASLERLNTSYIDLYLQHWPSKDYEIAETMSAMSELLKQGLVKYVGGSNFTPELLQQAQDALGDHLIACNQVGYHLNDRRIENDVLPYCQQHGITVMAYSPFGYAPQVLFGQAGFPQVGTNERKVLDEIGAKYGKTAYQVAINWILSHEGVVTIPKALSPEHIKSNAESIGWELAPEDLAKINFTFPKPAEGLELRKV